MKITSIIILLFLLLVSCGHPDGVKNNSQKAEQQHQDENIDPNKNESKGNQSQSSKPQTVVTVQQIVSLASTGHVINNPFASLQSTFSQVKKAWGEPDKVDQVGNSYYATYYKKFAVFGYTREDQIFDVRTNEPSIQDLTLADIKKAMGNPTSTTSFQNDQIYTYNLNKRYQLKWIIPTSTNKVDHISVYSQVELSNVPESYILSIKGTSQNLSSSAWESMLNWRQLILSFPKSYPHDVFVNGPNKKMVALTFDDGPDRINTPKIIAALKKENVRGTFFFIGQKVQQNPDIVKSAYDYGNVIGSHSYRHHELTKESTEGIRKDLINASKAIRGVIGKSPALLRPPFGDTDTKVITVAQEQQYKVIIWSIDTLDWSQKEQAHIEKNIFDNVRNGDIILMHSDDDKTETTKAVPTIIKELKRRGFELVDVATLLNTNPYH
ncbi:polysaccharide deacetylase family protein [Neobacillus sp. PS2-9]|uniref:polysaccharide deacetylase family protein n=1 Tax=Neobacillus sp. PS2-9 TaxID=3070676 RepID=UPI0027E1EFCD|nr:polysaccharide deacetylase family protein [Neobacillus sp. PS2-9]WML58645.1 polysaccharide deacetylase family protein [Neobacillus sp. PS2-9]